MTNTERAALQKEILDGARAVPENKPTQAATAAGFGFDATEYRRFERGERRLDIDELVEACEAEELAGPEAILGPIAKRFGLRLEREDAVPSSARELPRACSRFAALSAQLSAAAVEMMADGNADPDEVAAFETLLQSVNAAGRRISTPRPRMAR